MKKLTTLATATLVLVSTAIFAADNNHMSNMGRSMTNAQSEQMKISANMPSIMKNMQKLHKRVQELELQIKIMNKTHVTSLEPEDPVYYQ